MSRDVPHRGSAVASRRIRPAKSHSSIPRRVALCRSVLVAFSILVALVLIVDDSPDIVRFVLWYKTKFVDYYAPKVTSATKLMRRLTAFVPESVATEIQEAWDFSTAIVVVVSVYHLIERLRTSAIAKLR